MSTSPSRKIFDGNLSIFQNIPQSAVMLTPEQFGAVGDGVHDDSTALQNCFNAAAGRTVWLAGNYLHSVVVNISTNYVTVTGGGTITGNTPATQALEVTGNYVSLVGITLAATNVTSRLSAFATNKLWLNGCSYFYARDVYINGSAAAGVYFEGVTHSHLEHCRVYNSKADGYYITNVSSDIYLDGCVADTTGDYGFTVVSYATDAAVTSNIIMSGCRSKSSSTGGFDVVGGDSIRINDFFVESPQGCGINLIGDSTTYSNATNVFFDGGTIINANQSAGGSNSAILVYSANAGLIQYCNFTDIVIRNTNAAGSVIATLQYNTSTFEDVSFSNITTTNFTGTYFFSSTGTLTRVYFNNILQDGNVITLGSLDGISGIYNPKNYGAKGNAVVTTGGITASTTALSLTSGSFSTTDVGKTVVVRGAGTTHSVTDGAITSGTKIFTTSQYSFTSADIRSHVSIPGAGAAGATLVGYISKVVSSSTVWLAQLTSSTVVPGTTLNASTTVSGATCTISAYLVTTISSVSSGVATLAASAGRTVSGALMLYGTDDSTAINAAMTAATGGGQVYIPAGDYLVNSSISLNNANYVTVRGAGDGNTVIYGAGGMSGTAIFHTRGTFTSSSAPLTQHAMSDITLDGLFTQGTYSVDYCGVRATAVCSGCTWRDMTVRNTLATGFGCDNLFGGTSLHNLKALYNGASSWGVGPGCAGIGIGTLASIWNDFTVTACQLVGNGTYGIFLEGTVPATGPKIIGCSATANQIAGFADAGGSAAIWNGNESYANVLDGFTNTGTSLGYPGQDTLWVDNIAWGNIRNGFSYEPFQQDLSTNSTSTNSTCRVSYKNCKSLLNGARGFEINAYNGTLADIGIDSCDAYVNGGGGIVIEGATVSAQTGLVKNLKIDGGLVYSNNTTNGADTGGIKIVSNLSSFSVTSLNIRNVKAWNDGSGHQAYGLQTTGTLTLTDISVDNTNDFRGTATGAVSLSGSTTYSGTCVINPIALHTAVSATIAAGTGAGTSPTVAVSGDDVSGVVTITVGTSPSAGTLATVSFANTYLATPSVVLIAGDSASAVGGLYAVPTSSGFAIGCAGIPQASDAYTIYYSVKGS